MKVGFLVNSVSREAGGLFHSVRGLAKAVTSRNVNATAFGMSDPSSALDALEWEPVSVRTFHPQFRAWGYSSRFVPALLAADLDILSTHGLWKYCSVASRRWHRQTRRPYMVHPHGMLEPWALQNSRWKKSIAALLYENRHLHEAACLRALCDAEAQSIRSYGIQNPICVIPNGVALPPVEAKTTDHEQQASGPESQSAAFAKATAAKVASRQWSELGDRKVLLYLGRLHPKKNVANLIHAWASVRRSDVRSQKSTEWLLAIAGWDQVGYEAQLRKLTTDYGLLSSVKLLGPLFGPDKDAAYRACDAFILPSLSEGLPMTVLEAWAYAKPVLMTAECNLPEGFAADAAVQIGTTPAEIAAGLKKLTEMSNSDRSAMGDRGRTLVATKFSWPRIGEQMRSVYEWVLGGGPTPEAIRDEK